MIDVRGKLPETNGRRRRKNLIPRKLMNFGKGLTRGIPNVIPVCPETKFYETKESLKTIYNSLLSTENFIFIDQSLGNNITSTAALILYIVQVRCCMQRQ